MSEPIKKTDQAPEGYSPKEMPEIMKLAAGQAPQAGRLAENVLQGVPHMGYGNPSPVCYIGAVMRLMDYLGDPVEEDELFALSGAGLCFPWQYKSCCDEISILSAIPRRTFAALGYESEAYCEPGRGGEYRYDQPEIPAGARKYSKEFFMEKIRRSIDSGRPVLGFGLTAQNFACLVTGYYNDGEGLYLRAYWSPEGTPEGYDTEQYYRTEDWYVKCHGIAVIGEKTGGRLAGEEAYAHIRESAAVFDQLTSVPTQWGEVPAGFAAFDAMIAWLLDDSQWDKKDLHDNDVFLKPCGVLLLNYYRNLLHSYLGKLSAQCPALVHPGILLAIARMAELVQGAQHSDWDLRKSVDRRITKFSKLRDRALREKVAASIGQLKALDREIFDCLIGTEGDPS